MRPVEQIPDAQIQQALKHGWNEMASLCIR